MMHIEYKLNRVMRQISPLWIQLLTVIKLALIKSNIDVSSFELDQKYFIQYILKLVYPSSSSFHK